LSLVLFFEKKKMGNLWATPLTPSEMMSKSLASLRKASRSIEREMERLQEREEDVLYEMKDYAQRGKNQAVRTLAKELIRSRNAENKLLEVKIQLESTQHQIQTLHSTAAMTEAMKSTVRAMYAMNKQVDAQALQRIMMEFTKQNDFMDMKQDIMNDTLDSAMENDGDDTLQEELISKILDEVGIELTNDMANAPVRRNNNNSGLDDETMERLHKLKK
jgi:charged multivesicular body protein 2A